MVVIMEAEGDSTETGDMTGSVDLKDGAVDGGAGPANNVNCAP